MSDRLYYYRAKVQDIYSNDVYDGDSTWVDMDLGLGHVQKSVKLRWYAVDCPELNKPAQREAGYAARDRVRELLAAVDGEVEVRTYLDRRGKDRTGKFGRLLSVVYIRRGSRRVNLNRLLLSEGHALVRTYGDPVPDWAEGFPRHPSEL